MNKSIVVAANDIQRVELLTPTLESAGYSIIPAHHATDVLSLMQTENPDMLLIDSDLSGMEGFDLIRRITSKKEMIPIIVMGRNLEPELAITALESGAHDYIPDDRNEREILARISNLSRLFQIKMQDLQANIIVGDLVIDPVSRVVMRDGTVLEFTGREYDLLLYLAKHSGKVCTREDILRQVWDYDFHTGTNVVDVYILHLREKIDKGRRPKLLRTIRGAGYKLISQQELDTSQKDRLP
ncbi:response regulator transcription factor [Paenibacillus sp. JCM 10914]|uniref:response regulator transcription factor n=1 Tax=Paenibacillus sp. JCM 10914 TaxID=1236974 RepID=UPI0003CC767A|nr:response regulator transcription factor [Paenibacillus sp. JCM 10914]GAE05377.1 copper-sensing two-component system response regulator CusR [Paenibacillus sp. JCM 10914]